jgi:hypothetical protein
VKRARPKPIVGKVAYRVVNERGEELSLLPLRSTALFRAQRLAESIKGNDRHEYHITSVPLFGEPTLLYRVIRDQAGVVYTYIINEED